MLPFLDHLDMVEIKGIGTASDSIYQHETIISDESLLQAASIQGILLVHIKRCFWWPDHLLDPRSCSSATVGTKIEGTAALSKLQITFGTGRLSVKAFAFVKDMCYAHREW